MNRITKGNIFQANVVAEVGTLLAFTQAPGAILRCSACENIMLRIVQTPEAIYLDARGAVYIRLPRQTA